jgi:hypothetical protein
LGKFKKLAEKVVAVKLLTLMITMKAQGPLVIHKDYQLKINKKTQSRRSSV